MKHHANPALSRLIASGTNHDMRNNTARLALALSPLLLGLLAMAVLNWSGLLFALLMLGAMALYLILYLTVRCPACGKPLYLRETRSRLFGAYTFPTFERTCSKCGERQLP